MKGAPYTPVEDCRIREMFAGGAADSEIAVELRRTVEGVKWFRRRAGLLRRRREAGKKGRVSGTWTPEEETFIHENAAAMTLDELAAALGRTHKAVQSHMAAVMKLPKPYVRRPAGIVGRR